MYPVDRSEMSAARAAMMVRRRRSLTVLGVGAVVTTLLALIVGGLVWLVAALFLAGLAGYLLFLRGQARHDHQRRVHRSTDLASPRARREHVVRTAHPAEDDETVVRIDDDDISLQTMDTIDLTGLYPVADSESAAESAAERKAS